MHTRALGKGRGGFAQGLGIRLVAFGGAYWPLATGGGGAEWGTRCTKPPSFLGFRTVQLVFYNAQLHCDSPPLRPALVLVDTSFGGGRGGAVWQGTHESSPCHSAWGRSHRGFALVVRAHASPAPGRGAAGEHTRRLMGPPERGLGPHEIMYGYPHRS